MKGRKKMMENILLVPDSSEPEEMRKEKQEGREPC